METFFVKCITYVRNKIYNFITSIQIIIYSPKKIKNYKEFTEARRKNIGKFIVEFIDGYKLYCDTNDSNEVYAFFEPCVTEDYTRKLKSQINNGDIVFDIGAHVGSFSVYAAAKGAKVYSFEPNPINYKKLLDNIKLNNFEEKITPFNHAIANKEGKLELSYSEVNSGGHSLYTKTEKYFTVDAFTMEQSVQMAGVNHIDIFKIDTEGAEYEIFPSITPKIFESIKTIVGEYHLLPELPGKNFAFLKKILSPYYSQIEHAVPYYFKCSK